MNFFRKLFITSGLLIIASIMGYYLFLDIKIRPTYHIAIMTKVDGGGETARHTVHSAEMAVRKFLTTKNIKDFDIKVKMFDDAKKTPVENAKEAMKLPNLLAIVGHQSSGNTFDAMKVYAKYNVPVISPSASHSDLPDKYPRFYPIIFRNKEQGTFMPFYIKHILKKKHVIVIHDAGAYVQDLYKATMKQAEKLALDVVQDMPLGVEIADKALCQSVVNKLNLSADSVILLLTSNDQTTLDLLHAIRKKSTNQLIFACESVANTTVSGDIIADDNIYAITPHSTQLVNEEGYQFIKNYKRIYNEYPNWFGTHTYDAVDLICNSLPDLSNEIYHEKNIYDGKVSAVKGSDVNGSDAKGSAAKDANAKHSDSNGDTNIIHVRAKLLKNLKKVHYGITGRLDFRKNNYPTKDIHVASIRAKEWQPAPLQLIPVLDPNTITKLETEIKNGHVIFDGQLYYRVGNVVYTGTAIKSISDIDLTENSCVVEYFLWFRHLPQNKSVDMIFLNSFGQSVLGERHVANQAAAKSKALDQKMKNVFSKSKKSESQEEKPAADMSGMSGMGVSMPVAVPENKEENTNIVDDQIQIQVLTDKNTQNHILYKIKQKFALGTLPLNEYEYLKYAKSAGITMRPKLDPQQSIRLVTDVAVLDHIPRIDQQGWDIIQIETFCDHLQETTFGNPRFEKDKSLPFSRFNTKIVMDRTHLLPVIHMSYKTSVWILLVSLFVFIFSFYFDKQGWILRLTSILTLNVSAQSFLISYAQSQGMLLHLKTYFVICFDMLSWMMVAYIMSLIVRVHYFRRMEEESNMPVPHLLKMLIYVLIGIITGSAIIAFVFNYTITGLLTSGGFFVAIIGFAIQQNLSHIFSGLMLNVEKPFRIGDWVKLGPETGGLIGKVLDVTWRSTRVLTIQNNIISVPNSKIGESLIENFNYPDDLYIHTFEILLDRNHNPDEIMKVMRKSVHLNDLVLEFDMQPRRIEDENMVYVVFVSAADFENSRLIIWGEVLTQIWHGLKKAGLHTVKVRHYVKEGEQAQAVHDVVE